MASLSRFHSLANRISVRAIFLLLILSITTAAQAAEPWTPASLAKAETLADSPRWRALLHYYPGTLGRGWKSQVDDPDFFLAPDGVTHPRAELDATVAAFYLPVTDANQHAVCRFPARWHWLRDELSLPPAPLTTEQCPERSQWLGIIKPHSIKLIFASSYLNSPSSMFGHTFLRIDPENIDSGSDWLSFAVNFGAEYRPEDNSLLYAWKGIFGGYPGFFSLLRYHEKINEYNRIENRDLWEYQLDLSPEQVQLLVDHLWELRNIDFDYYFFDENCSFRLLELLEVARPDVELTDGFEHRAIPIDTVRAVLDAGLVRDTQYRSAAATQLQFQADQLSTEHQGLAWELAHRKRPLTDTAFTTLPSAQRAAILRVAYQHLRYQQSKATRDSDTAALSLDMLRQLRDISASEPPQPPRPATPESGHDTLLVGLAGGRADGNGLVDLRLRTSYHDLADNSTGYLNGAAINLGELQLRQRENDSLQVEMLNFVDINSHAPRNRFFDPITWRVRAGFDRVYTEHDDALTARVNGGAGVTYEVGNNQLAYGMAIARLEYNPLLEDNLGLGGGALAGTLWFTPIGTLQLEAEHYQFTDGHERHELKLVHNLPLGRNDALRLNLLQRQQLETRFNEATLEFRHFF
jgi:hypothetical protein